MPAVATRVDRLRQQYTAVRQFSDRLCETLNAEDCVVQSMPDVSPTRWHLAHTTWFFETFLLAKRPGYRRFHSDYAYLFNSYYNSIGDPFPRSNRGLLSRPTLSEIKDFRHYVDDLLLDVLSDDRTITKEQQHILELGLHHEQQHQELMLTDIKHVFSCNPTYPVYRQANWQTCNETIPQTWLEFEAGVHQIGHNGAGFAFDNEFPQHRVFLEPFAICNRPVTCAEYLTFMDAGGYHRPELWLSLGWQQVQEQNWQAPLYWVEQNQQWYQFTLSGLQQLSPESPICHLSYFEADAFARWADGRLPTEAEWEVASVNSDLLGNFADTLLETDSPVHPCRPYTSDTDLLQMYGDVWEWTCSSYAPYPGYRTTEGALGEYNGKFMCNQYVLRGGSCATSSSHIRSTYRNFFPPETRWQFSGLRLCRSL